MEAEAGSQTFAEKGPHRDSGSPYKGSEDLLACHQNFCHQNLVLFALMLFLRLGKTQTATTTFEIQAEFLKSTKKITPIWNLHAKTASIA